MSHVGRPVTVVSGVLLALALAGWGVNAAMSHGGDNTRNTSQSVAQAPAQASGVGGGYVADPGAPSPATSDAPTGDAPSAAASDQAGDQLAASTMSGIGSTVTDGSGHAVYRFDRDTRGGKASACDSACRSMWSPVIVDNEHPRVRGIDVKLVATIRLADGRLQATIAGWPVYRYNGDHRAGTDNGQGRNGQWWLVRPDGKKNMAGAMPAPTYSTPPGNGGEANAGGAGAGNDPHHW